MHGGQTRYWSGVRTVFCLVTAMTPAVAAAMYTSPIAAVVLPRSVAIEQQYVLPETYL